MYHLVISDLSEENLPSLAAMTHVSLHYWLTDRSYWSGVPLCQRNQQVSTSIVSPNQPQHHETVLGAFQQLRVQPTYF